MDYKEKYLKYKQKYFDLKKKVNKYYGGVERNINLSNNLLSENKLNEFKEYLNNNKFLLEQEGYYLNRYIDKDIKNLKIVILKKLINEIIFELNKEFNGVEFKLILKGSNAICLHQNDIDLNLDLDFKIVFFGNIQDILYKTKLESIEHTKLRLILFKILDEKINNIKKEVNDEFKEKNLELLDSENQIFFKLQNNNLETDIKTEPYKIVVKKNIDSKIIKIVLCDIVFDLDSKKYENMYILKESNILNTYLYIEQYLIIIIDYIFYYYNGHNIHNEKKLSWNIRLLDIFDKNIEYLLDNYEKMKILYDDYINTLNKNLLEFLEVSELEYTENIFEKYLDICIKLNKSDISLKKIIINKFNSTKINWWKKRRKDEEKIIEINLSKEELKEEEIKEEEIEKEIKEEELKEEEIKEKSKMKIKKENKNKKKQEKKRKEEEENRLIMQFTAMRKEEENKIKLEIENAEILEAKEAVELMKTNLEKEPIDIDGMLDILEKALDDYDYLENRAFAANLLVTYNEEHIKTELKHLEMHYEYIKELFEKFPSWIVPFYKKYSKNKKIEDEKAKKIFKVIDGMKEKVNKMGIDNIK